jgi:choline-sulfatase
MKQTFLLSLALPWAIANGAQAGEAAAKAAKPNIIFIFADDLSINALGSTSNGEVLTPNLDKLRAQGTFFNQTFNQGGYNGAVSVASRAMMNTGKYLWKAMDAVNGASGKSEWPQGITPYKAQKPATPPTLWSQHMKQAGYDTYMTGKWHVSTPADKVFDHVVHVRGGMPNQSKARYDRKFIEGQPDTWSAADTTHGGFWKGGKHWSEVLKDDAIGFIDKAKDESNPFFMYLAFNAPHDPRQAPQEFLDMYPLERISVPKSFIPEYPYCEEAGSGKGLRDERLAPFPRTKYAVKVNRKEYYALITHLDTQIGQIMQALEASGKAENTYIFFTADHGLAVGDHGFVGKQNMYDASVRVPMLAVGPTIKKGVTLDNMVYLQDVMATALDIAGSSAVQQVDFQSFLPLAQGKKQQTREAIYGAYVGAQRMVRTDDYKMIIYPKANKVRLYHIAKDPHELVDLASNKRYIKKMRALFKEFQKMQKQTNDPLDVAPYFEHHIQSIS